MPCGDTRDTITESGGAELAVGAIADGQVLKRVGAEVQGASGAPPTGAAGGALSGTYPNPGLADGAVTNAKVGAAAAIAESKLALAFPTHSNALDHSNANDPSAGEKAALAGTSGAPGVGNKFVTDADARNTNQRDPAISAMAAETTIDRQSDYAPVYDASAAGNRKMVPRDLGVGVLNRLQAPTEIVNDNTEQTLYTFSVPQSLMGTKFALRLLLAGDYLNNTGSAQVTTVRVKFGATTLYDGTFNPASGAQRRGWSLLVFLTNYAAANAQEAAITLQVSATGTPSTGTGMWAAAQIFAGTVYGTSAEDTGAAAKSLTVTVQHTNANANLAIKVRQGTLELV